MIFKLAFKNILGNGWRSLINVFIIALVLTGLIWMEAMWFSWLSLAKTQARDWEFSSGMLRVKSYDPYDVFSLEHSYAPIPAQARQFITAGEIVPLLYSPGVIYPGGRMMSALVKGIPGTQKLLRLPTETLNHSGADLLPAIVGKAMAKSARLQQGDVFTLRIKDSTGAFNAVDLRISKVMDCPVPSLDLGTVWIDLNALQQAKQLPGMATALILNNEALASVAGNDYKVISAREFFTDLDRMVKTKVSGQASLFVMMIFLAMLAIFDTQALAIFKRRKEIGMLSALGMTKAQIILLFTSEGALYMVAATLVTGVLGFPLFRYFAVTGFSLPKGSDSFGVAGFNEALKFIYPLPLILITLIQMFILTVFVSWLPARKIAGLNPTDALRGK